mmetsp:Transcript_26110/g.42787  ORF Transcript_26110/g.42787 Transcript_26110/m.42787 type:complete len:708 (-) Transcript_26110:48-2171(-)|eukprot:CAMPEP_0184335158 /NCGR_PEP_ID=MMETSP1089-20130417/3777_1 /TAXON_ID=38269 ORGANISM="Gloeochaete wittrockiana, Strain SAG46.84" /NCGR_SAMPLE_ID=MMETSP1089 /ASSEMBLY_ACC=CAM_ASM_000445 /LENGTH=707 /DNA_ID=CAMNT_0026659695 /DNA_START=65 /DNA_END=2188 /DNA_ORIENTATION=-
MTDDDRILLPSESFGASSLYKEQTADIIAERIAKAFATPVADDGDLEEPPRSAVGVDPIVLVPSGTPLLKLSKVLSYNGMHARNIFWTRDSSSIIYPAGSTVVVHNLKTDTRSFLLGHTAIIHAMTFNRGQETLATCQDGTVPMVRLWKVVSSSSHPHESLALFHPGLASISTMDFSFEGQTLCVAGKDNQARPVITLWDISTIPNGDPICKVRHVSMYFVSCAVFSPFEDERLVTCGLENVRLYRIKDGRLRGLSVPLGTHGPGNVFQDIGFEGGFRSLSITGKRMFVSNDHGAVYQINYGQRSLECVFKVAHGPLQCLAVTEGFCVVGSDDGSLRLFPLDFADCFLEAQHEGKVTAVSLSYDCMKVAVGTESSSVGILDLATHEYKTCLRAHNDVVLGVAADPSRPEFCTVSQDGTIRVWSIETGGQLFEFQVDSPEDIPLCVSYHPTSPAVVVGFHSGTVRLLEIPHCALLAEYKQHTCPVRTVLFSQNALRMYSVGQDGNVCMYDSAYRPLKMLCSVPNTCVALSPDSICLSSSDANNIILFDALSLTQFKAISIPSSSSSSSSSSRSSPSVDAVTSLAFSSDSKELVACYGNALQRYSVQSGELLAELPLGAAGPICDLAVAPLNIRPALIATGGTNGHLRLWSLSLSNSSAMVKMKFIGHSSEVSGVVFANKGKQVVTVGGDSSICIWNVVADVTKDNGCI